MSADTSSITPILMLGAGRMGGALIEGWALTKAFAGAQLIIRDPNPSDAARPPCGRRAAQSAGCGSGRGRPYWWR